MCRGRVCCHVGVAGEGCGGLQPTLLFLLLGKICIAHPELLSGLLENIEGTTTVATTTRKSCGHGMLGKNGNVGERSDGYGGDCGGRRGKLQDSGD